MKPIYEIIVMARPSYILGDKPTYIGCCPLHGYDNAFLQFEEDGPYERVKMFCHSCHYTDKENEDILAAWGLTLENLYVSREMNAPESIYIEAKANLIRLELEGHRLHGLDWNENVKARYLEIINERIPWVKQLEKYWQM